MRLILPEMKFMPSYIDCCREAAEAKMPYNAFMDTDGGDFGSAKWSESLLTAYELYREGRCLPEGHVPGTEFWLIDGGEVVGVGNIRHSLTPDLLRFGGHIGYSVRPSAHGRGYGTENLRLLLVEAAKLGIKRALITCNEKNMASARVIEKNGGVLQDIVGNTVDGESIRTKRYWVKTGL